MRTIYAEWCLVVHRWRNTLLGPANQRCQHALQVQRFLPRRGESIRTRCYRWPEKSKVCARTSTHSISAESCNVQKRLEKQRFLPKHHCKTWSTTQANRVFVWCEPLWFVLERRCKNIPISLHGIAQHKREHPHSTPSTRILSTKLRRSRMQSPLPRLSCTSALNQIDPLERQSNAYYSYIIYTYLHTCNGKGNEVGWRSSFIKQHGILAPFGTSWFVSWAPFFLKFK